MLTELCGLETSQVFSEEISKEKKKMLCTSFYCVDRSGKILKQASKKALVLCEGTELTDQM